MDFKTIQELLRMISKTDLSEVEIELKDFKIKTKRSIDGPMFIQQPQVIHQVSAAPQLQNIPPLENTAQVSKSDAETSATATSNNLFEYKSPIIGTFYRSSGPDKDSLVKVGDEIKKGQVLCIIEAMKLFNEIESEVDGRVVKILVENAQPVEYDQPLFLVELA